MFSDVHNFTLTSNMVSANELVDWLAYTFSVMDGVAEYYRIYKVGCPGTAFPEMSSVFG